MRELLEDRPKFRDHAVMDPVFVLSTRRWIIPALVCSSTVFIYLQVFVLPCTPRLASGDQAIYLHHATRMLAGEMIYRDYDHFTLPGTDVLYAALFKLFGVRAWIPQAMLVVLGAFMVWLIVHISKKLLPGTIAYLPALLFLALPFSSYLDATHHWYSLVAATAALAIVLEHRTLARLACAGTCLALATFFTQSMALLAIGFALFLLWEHREQAQARTLFLKQELSLLLSFLGATSALMAYFVWKVGLKQIWYYTGLFVVKYYPADWFNNWHVYLTGRPQLHAWTTWLDVPAFLLIHLIVPFVYILFFVGYSLEWWRPRSAELRRSLVLINIAGFFLFLTIASAPAYSRLYAVSPPALLLLVWLLSSTLRPQRLLLTFAWATVLFLLIARPLVSQIRWKEYLTMPTGRTAFFNPLLYEKCKWASEHTHPSDYFFGDHLLSFTLGLRNVGRVPFLRPTDYTRPEEVADAIQGLEKFQVRYVSWYIGLDRERDALGHPEGNHLAPIRQYLQQHYRIAKTFANGDQIWERSP